MAIDDSVRAIVDLRDRTLQKNRIAMGNRIDAVVRGVDRTSKQAEAVLRKWHERFDALETEADKDIAALVKGERIVEELTALRGIGPLLAAKLVAMIDIERCDTISALWKYAGYGVTQRVDETTGETIGERDRPIAGQKRCYNARLKTTLYLVAGSFLKANSPYRAVYNASREYYEANRPTWTKAHQHLAALRRMIKLFLSHLYKRWRSIEGLPIRPPYSHERLGHVHMEEAEAYGWRPLALEAAA